MVQAGMEKERRGQMREGKERKGGGKRHGKEGRSLPSKKLVNAPCR